MGDTGVILPRLSYYKSTKLFESPGWLVLDKCDSNLK